MFNYFLKNLGNFSIVNSIRDKSINILIIIFVIFFAIGAFIVFNYVPDDYLQGVSAKIMYLHVPSAWACSLIYLIMTIASIGFLVYKNLFCAFFAYSIAISGIFFNLICIITGMIWAKQTWGVYWVWDARLISVVILLFFYIFYITIFNLEDSRQSINIKIASISNLIGAINLPIIKFSVELWNSVHQPASILRAKGVSIEFSMFYPLLIFFLIFAIFTTIISILKLHSLLLEKKINHLVTKDLF